MDQCNCKKENQPIKYNPVFISHEIKRERKYPKFTVTKKEVKNESL